jgi:ankyrin repeat protein
MGRGSSILLVMAAWLVCGSGLAQAQPAATGAHLLVAARNGDLETVRRLLDQGVDVHTREAARPNVGRTPLHYSAGSYFRPGARHLDVARLLISSGADVNAEADSGYTPLHVASGLGQTPMVDLLLKAGGNPNALDTRGTPLHAAVLGGHKEVVELLLKNGARFDIGDSRGTRPLNLLYRAAAWRPSYDEIVEMLVRAGAPLESGPNNVSALVIAAKMERKQLLTFLVEHGASATDEAIEVLATGGHKEALASWLARGLVTFDRPEPGTVILHGASCNLGRDFFEWALFGTKNMNQRDKDGRTPLHWAARCGREAHVERLIERGADVGAPDGKGVTPIGEAARGAMSIYQALLRAGADPNATIDRRDEDTILWNAVSWDDGQLAQLLLANGADVNRKNKRGRTALHQAALLSKPVAAYVLASGTGVRLDETDAEGYTALHHAAKRGAREVVQILLAKGANKSLKTFAGKTALDLAAEPRPWGLDMSDLLR